MINDGGPAFPVCVNATDSSGEDFGVIESKGMSLRDYFAATMEPLESRSSMESVTALAGRPRPHNEKFRRFQNGEGKRTDPTPEEWLDYFRWWADADSAMRYIRADAMIAARKPKETTSED